MNDYGPKGMRCMAPRGVVIDAPKWAVNAVAQDTRPSKECFVSIQQKGG